MRKLEVEVKGMCCDHCAANVNRGLKEITGVKDVEVDLREGLTFITIDENTDINRVINNIRNKINYLGYIPGEIRIIEVDVA
ncbi:copper chaperone [Sulfolobus sp. E5-1-F]|uniref:heavy-metal-associated domain-containing protein n=1 Tax=Sulfolobaceae TaxID=118883 RepID=UPI0012982361|nr:MULTISPECIES: heavy-metal-associated domain-containing protein [unclassified Sulfolobus]QGA53791.1 copper chaperone [Sulfolobus sp. E5-1-F]QGA68552.1 copper chaperone [Sulfolobus sp. E11-6]